MSIFSVSLKHSPQQNCTTVVNAHVEIMDKLSDLSLQFMPAHYRVRSCSVGNYFCAENGKKHARGGQTELYLTHTLTHTHGCGGMGKGPSVWERWREGSIEQRKSAVNHERRQKPPVFPQCTRLCQPGSYGATTNTLSHSHTYRNTCIQSPGSSGVMKEKKKNSVYPGNINKRLWEPTHTLAEGGIVLFQTPSDRRLRGIDFYSLFMSYGAL